MRDLKNTKILCCGADALTAHPDFFAHDSGKILLQIGAAGAAYLRADGFEPEMVCGPNVLAMTSPCDDADALERLADVLHAWDKTAVPPAAPRHILPAPGAARCTIAEALLRPARAVRMRDAVGETAAEYLWAYPPGVPLVAPGEEVTAELVTACIGAGRNRAEAYGRQRGGGDCGFVICKGRQRHGPSEPFRPALRAATSPDGEALFGHAPAKGSPSGELA